MVSTWQPYKAGMVICACQIWTGKWEWHKKQDRDIQHARLWQSNPDSKVTLLHERKCPSLSLLSFCADLGLSFAITASAAAAVRNCLGPSRGMQISKSLWFLGVIKQSLTVWAPNPQASSVLQTWAASWSEGPGDPEEEAPVFRCQKD